MDKKILVKKIRDAIEEVEKEEGNFSLVMIIPVNPELLGNKYNLLISAPWLDSNNPKSAISFILDKFKDQLSNEDLSDINRINVINTGDMFVGATNDAFPVDHQEVPLNNVIISGQFFPEVILLESRKIPDPDKPNK